MPENQSQPAIYQEEPIEAIVGREPNWIIRSGITLISVMLFIFILLAWFIQYPNTLEARVKITPNIPSAELASKITGRVQQVFVEDGSDVKKGQPLILMETNVDQEELSYLEEQLRHTLHQGINMSKADILALDVKQLTNMGELQKEFELWRDSIYQLKLESRSQEIVEEINGLKQLSEETKLLNKKKNWEQVLVNQSSAIKKQRGLAEKGVVSDLSLLPLENEYLIQQVSLDDLNIDIKRNELTVVEYEQQIKLLGAKRLDNENLLVNTIRRSTASLINSINDWKHIYLISSPVDGVLSMTQDLKQNQQVTSGQTLMNIASQGNVMSGSLILGHIGAGKLDLGQQVNIELDSFPAAEYGKIAGEVSSISLVPSQDGYLVLISLPNEFITTTGYDLPLIPNLLGTAKIITEKRSVIERLFSQITYLIRATE
jgi:HlyD family secretion protein